MLNADLALSNDFDKWQKSKKNLKKKNINKAPKKRKMRGKIAKKRKQRGS